MLCGRNFFHEKWLLVLITFFSIIWSTKGENLRMAKLFLEAIERSPKSSEAFYTEF